MDHVNSSVVIYFTKEYGRFKLLNENRQINQNKINRIKHDIAAGLDMLKFNPINVREEGNRLHIVDGQHRFMVSKQLSCPVWYTIVPHKMDVLDIAKINSNSERWKKSDYIHAFTTTGNEHYETLQKFIDTWGISFSVAVKLLTTGSVGGDHGLKESSSHSFQRGKLTIEHLAKATTFMQTCSRFRFFSKWKRRPFMIAIEQLILAKKVDMDALIDKCCLHQDRMTEKGEAKSYLVMLEEVYNIGTHKRKTIF